MVIRVYLLRTYTPYTEHYQEGVGMMAKVALHSEYSVHT